MKRLRYAVKHILLPISLAATFGYLFRNLYYQDGVCNYMLAWIVIGFPFGAMQMRIYFLPGKYDLVVTVGLVVVRLMLSGLMGSFWLISHIIGAIVVILIGRY